MEGGRWVNKVDSSVFISGWEMDRNGWVDG
jgi:hypothetical protein